MVSENIVKNTQNILNDDRFSKSPVSYNDNDIYGISRRSPDINSSKVNNH